MNKLQKSLLIGLLLTTITSCRGGNNSSVSNEISSPSSNSIENTTNTISNSLSVSEEEEVLLEELRAGIMFFYEGAQRSVTAAYGLIPDRYNVNGGYFETIASIASVGYGLTAYQLGIEYGWLDREEVYDLVSRTFTTLENLERIHGFYYHFINMSGANAGKRAWSCELSVIDTAILINGVLTIGHYFGGELKTRANLLYEAVEWNWYFNTKNNRFYMGYKPETGFEGAWDQYAEQLMIYILAAGSPTHSVGIEAYNTMKSGSKKAYKTEDYDAFYMTWTGSIFTYQFSHAWANFRGYNDKEGINWYDNSVNATKASRAYAVANANKYKTYSEVSWGFTACDGPNGYRGDYGSAPSAGGAHYLDGTVPPCGALGSLPFLPQEVIAAANNYRSVNKLWSKYGFIDSYNLGTAEGYTNKDITGKIPANGWYNKDIIGIDKGISVLMIGNYLTQTTWDTYMQINYIKLAYRVLGLTKGE